MLRHLERHGLADLYQNPLMLRLVGTLADTGAELPRTRGGLLDRVCSVLWPERDEDRFDNHLSRLTEEQVLSSAGAIMAGLLSAGAEAVRLEGPPQDGELGIADFRYLPDTEGARPVLSSKLFQGAGVGRAVPIHRIIAEFLAARWLAKRCDTPRCTAAAARLAATLYDTLDAWAGYAAGPSAWRERRLRELIAVEPRIGGGARAPGSMCPALPCRRAEAAGGRRPFGRLVRPADGASVVQRTRRGARALGMPIIRRSGDARGLPGRPCQDAAFYEHLGRVLDFGRIEPEPTLARAWRITIAARLGGFDLERAQRYQFVVRRVKALEIDRHVRDAVIEVVRPRLEVGSPVRPSSEAHSRDTAPCSLEDLVHVRFSSEGYPTVREILLDWPRVLGHELDLFLAADRALAEALDQARDAGHLDRIDLASLDVLSVSAGEGDELGHGFLPTTRMVAMLWDRVASGDGPRARGLATAWGVSDYLLHRRLHLHALADAAFGGDAIVPALEGLDDRVFWASEARREITRLVQARWSDLPDLQRSWIEAKMRLGPPRRLARDATVTDDEWGVVRDYALFQLLDPVRSAGGALAPETLAELEGIRSRHPDFGPRGSEDDEVRSATIMTPRGHPERLSDAADEVLLS